jgi:hypothetical protein
MTNGNSVAAQITGTAPAAIVALTPNLYIAMGATVPWGVEAVALSASGAAVTGQSMTWSAGGTAVSLESAQSVTAANGVASNTVTAGPFNASVASGVNACLAGTSSCVSFSVIPVQPSTEALAAWSGTAQSVAASQAFAPVVLHVTDAFGDPVAGANVTFAEAFYGWTTPCAEPGNCPRAPLLATQTAQATSGLDGSVTLTPLNPNGVAGQLLVMAVTGTDTTLTFELDAHP